MNAVIHSMLPDTLHRRCTPGLGVFGLRFLHAFVVLVVLLGTASAIQAQTVVTLAWDANTEPDIAGYEVSYGTQSQVYTTTVDVGNATSRPFTIAFGVAHYFVVKAYNSSNPRQYSPYSTEVSAGATVAPVGLVATPGELSVNLSWQSPAEATLESLLGFAVYRLDEIGQYSLVTTVAGNATFNTTIVGLNAGENYVFSVTANDAQTGESGYSDSASATPFAAEPVPVLTWATPAPIVQGPALSASQLNATASVPGTFVYAPAAGTVLGVGTHALSVTFTSTGTASPTTLTASVNLVVSPRTAPAITWATPAAIIQGTALSAAQLNATASVAGTFVYTPAAGTVLAAGTRALSVTFAPTNAALYTTATASVNLVVNLRTAPVITWATPAAIVQGAALSTAQLNATAGVAGTFVYTPAAGTVLAAGTRALSVTFTPTDAALYTTATASVNLVVNVKTAPVITWATPAAIVQGAALGAAQLNATAGVAGTFVYTPAAGTVLAVGTQLLSVMFTPTDAALYATATASVSLVVSPKFTPMIAWATPAAIVQGTALGAAQLNATSTIPGTFVYTPAAGTVLAVGTQVLSVTFTPTNAALYTTATASVSLAVNAKTAPVITWATPAAIVQGAALSTAQLNAVASVAGTFVYAPAAGTVLAVGTQVLSVAFTPTDAALYTTATASVSLSVNPRTAPVITWATPAAIVQGAALSSAQLNATASVAGTFVYTPAAGTVLAVGTQVLSVAFTPTDAALYTTATASVNLVVSPKFTPMIAWATPAAIVQGTALGAAQLNATSTIPGTFAYTPIAGTVLAAGTQVLSVTFTPTDSARYTTVTASVSLVVNGSRLTPVISWSTPKAIVQGTALGSAQLTATSTVPGTFVYTPAAGTVLAVGTQTLSVFFTPSDSSAYTTATKRVSLTVNRRTPVITWSRPAAIVEGTRLSSVQLNARASVPGSFVYSPKAGTVLKAGTRSLSVIFTPADTALYLAVKASVTVLVTRH